MLLRQIKYFQTVVEKGSFTEAAEACYISQSAISQQIQSLEKEIGVKLFERKNRKFTLTPQVSISTTKPLCFPRSLRGFAEKPSA